MRKPSKEQHRLRPGWWSSRALSYCLVVLVLTLLIRKWIWVPVIISGDSMLPTFHSGALVGINKVAYRFGSPRRGDVVGLWAGHELLVKRVLALPGEQVAIRDGQFWINGRLLQEPYVRFKDHGEVAPGRLGSDQFLVAGDNRVQSLVAIVNRDRIAGRLRTSSVLE